MFKNNIDNLKAEFYIPIVIDEIIRRKSGSISVLDCNAKWFGVTYQEDKPTVLLRLKEFAENGTYPSPLWG